MNSAFIGQRWWDELVQRLQSRLRTSHWEQAIAIANKLTKSHQQITLDSVLLETIGNWEHDDQKSITDIDIKRVESLLELGATADVFIPLVPFKRNDDDLCFYNAIDITLLSPAINSSRVASILLRKFPSYKRKEVSKIPPGGISTIGSVLGRDDKLKWEMILAKNFCPNPILSVLRYCFADSLTFQLELVEKFYDNFENVILTDLALLEDLSLSKTRNVQHNLVGLFIFCQKYFVKYEITSVRFRIIELVEKSSSCQHSTVVGFKTVLYAGAHCPFCHYHEISLSMKEQAGWSNMVG